MPSATATSYEEEFLSERVLNFSHNNDFVGGPTFSGLNNLGYPLNSQKNFSLDKEIEAVSSNIKSDPVTCNSPIHTSSSGYNVSAPSHLFHNNTKISNGMINSAFTTPNPGNKILDDFHSLQNSPFYNHYPLSVKRQNESSGVGMQNCGGNNCNSLLMHRRPPQIELFPPISNGWSTLGGASNNQPTGLFMQDRLYYNSVAQKFGFIVGQELERIKENSRRSTSHTYGRISAHFRNRYGETEAKTKASYLQLGVRVPTKDHVSEIVGKGGQKIKLIREETGALITTPGEHEDHVFIIEAPPEIALSVAELISNRALEITQSKANASERRRGSTSSIPGCMSLFSVNGAPSASNGGRLLTRSPDELQSVTIPSSSPLLKSPINSLTNSTVPGTASHSADNVFSFSSNCNGNGLSVNNGGSNANGSSGGRVLLARSKISVPQDMVGKIIGTQGSIITTIQKDTGTEIKSPPKEAIRGPSATSEFEISAYQSLGMTTSQAAESRVQQAKQLIGHLVMRQFERRCSEDLDDNTGSASSGKSRSNSNGDDSEEGKFSNGSSKTIAWMWPDVQQMDSKEAQDVLDRILAESKSKTRRVKELQAAAAASTAAAGAGSLPASPCGIVSSGNNGFGSEFFPAEKSTGSCQNSPFHQPRIASHSNVFSANATGPGSGSLLSGFLPERRLTNVDFHSESEFQDNNHVGICSNSFFWSNPGPRHSFSAGAPLVVGDNSPALLRRHTMASAESNGHNNSHRHQHSLLDDSVDKQSVNETDYNIMQALGNLGLEGDDSSPDHPPGFVSSHFHAKRLPSSSGWPSASFFNNGSLTPENVVNKLETTRNSIWSNVPIQALPENLTHSAIPAIKSISSSSSGSVNQTSNRCGTIGEGRRRTSPSGRGSAAPTEAA